MLLFSDESFARKQQRSMLDVGMGMLRSAIEYKLAEAGGFFVEVPTVKIKPSQRCASCWELTPKTLADRLHICQHCRHTEDRDINSAQVCLIWAKGLGTSLSNVDGSSSTSTHCGGFKQLAQMKRQKLQVQPSGDLE